MPKRIQRKRTKGWRMPEGVRYVGRGSVFGNPFNWKTADPDAGPLEYRKGVSVDLYRDWLAGTGSQDMPSSREEILSQLQSLRGKDLACWCKEDEPCHADVLLELANQ